MQIPDSDEVGVREKPRRVAAIVLAAGSSQRMGPDNKLLIKMQGSTLVRTSVQTAITSNVQSTIVVLGHEAQPVTDALEGLEYQAEINSAFADGMSSSLRAGVKAAKGFDAVAVLLADMPGVESKILNALLTVFSQQETPAIVVATHAGRRGHPVIWSAEYYPELLSLSGDVGGKQLLQKYSHRVIEVEVGSDSIFVDIDTPADLDAVKSLQLERA